MDIQIRLDEGYIFRIGFTKIGSGWAALFQERWSNRRRGAPLSPPLSPPYLRRAKRIEPDRPGS